MCMQKHRVVCWRMCLEWRWDLLMGCCTPLMCLHACVRAMFTTKTNVRVCVHGPTLAQQKTQSGEQNDGLKLLSSTSISCSRKIRAHGDRVNYAKNFPSRSCSTSILGNALYVGFGRCMHSYAAKEVRSPCSFSIHFCLVNICHRYAYKMLSHSHGTIVYLFHFQFIRLCIGPRGACVSVTHFIHLIHGAGVYFQRLGRRYTIQPSLNSTVRLLLKKIFSMLRLCGCRPRWWSAQNGGAWMRPFDSKR